MSTSVYQLILFIEKQLFAHEHWHLIAVKARLRLDAREYTPTAAITLLESLV
jgi:hypothetical protein